VNEMAFISWKQQIRIPDYLIAEEVVTGLLEFNPETCLGCSICASICPARSIVVPDKKRDPSGRVPFLEEIAPDVTLCIACGCCLAACPEQAIRMTRGFRAAYFFERLTQDSVLTYPQKY